MGHPEAKAHVALLFVQVIFGVFPVIGKVGLAEFDTGVFAMLRVFGGMLLLVATAMLTVGMRRPPAADLARFAVFAFFGVSLNQALFLMGLDRSTAVNAVILVATIPVFTYVFAVLAGREPFGPRRASGIALALAGVLVIVDPRRFQTDRSVMIGNVLLLANSASYAWYLVISKPVAERYRAIEFTAWVFVLGAPFLALVFIPSWPAFGAVSVTGRAWWALAGVIVGPTFAAYALNSYGLRRVSSSTVAAFVFVQPVITAALAAWYLDEAIEARHVVAAILVLAGVTLVARRGRGGPPAP